MRNQIINKIKNEIGRRLPGHYYSFNGSNKRITGIERWSNYLAQFAHEFDVAQLPNQTSFQGNLWVYLDIDGNVKRVVNINISFGPIEISLEDSNYIVDCTSATFTFLYQ
jgi:hypothetical protein